MKKRYVYVKNSIFVDIDSPFSSIGGIWHYFRNYKDNSYYDSDEKCIVSCGFVVVLNEIDYIKCTLSYNITNNIELIQYRIFFISDMFNVKLPPLTLIEISENDFNMFHTKYGLIKLTTRRKNSILNNKYTFD